MKRRAVLGSDCKSILLTISGRVESAKKLQVFFARASALTDSDVEQICGALKQNNAIKVLDFSSNRELTGRAIACICDLMTANRSLEYLGLSKLGLTAQNLLPLFEMIGRFPFPEDQVEN